MHGRGGVREEAVGTKMRSVGAFGFAASFSFSVLTDADCGQWLVLRLGKSPVYGCFFRSTSQSVRVVARARKLLQSLRKITADVAVTNFMGLTELSEGSVVVFLKPESHEEKKCQNQG